MGGPARKRVGPFLRSLHTEAERNHQHHEITAARGHGLHIAFVILSEQRGKSINGSFTMLEQLSLAVLEKAFALLLGNVKAEANHCQLQSRWNRCRQSQYYSRVRAGCRRRHNTRQNHYDQDADENGSYRSHGRGYRDGSGWMS